MSGAADYPFQNAHVLTVTRPHKFAVLIFSEPVYGKDRRRIGKARAKVEPVAEIIAHVIAAERKHRERIAADLTDISKCGGRHLRTHRRSHVNAKSPIERLLDQRNDAVSTTSKYECRYRNAGRIIKIFINDRTLGY